MARSTTVEYEVRLQSVKQRWRWAVLLIYDVYRMLTATAAVAGFPMQLAVTEPADPSWPVSALTACLMRESVIMWKISYSLPIN